LIVVRHLGLLLTVAFAILFLSLLSADVWRAAAHLTRNEALGLILFTLVPLFVGVWIQLVRSLPESFRQAAEALAAEGGGLLDIARNRVEELLDPGPASWKRASRQEPSDLPAWADLVDSAFASSSVAPRAEALGIRLRPSFRWRFGARLAPLIIVATAVLA